ncbi:hypothetical protein [Desulforamulus reducens]|uniref:hypothetical protein n=1 Tax=Desulforamulus reducens TaxID=59610 RepID=UPI0002F04643|nr:hypothetical protein [Desulforamulus reducens]
MLITLKKCLKNQKGVHSLIVILMELALVVAVVGFIVYNNLEPDTGDTHQKFVNKTKDIIESGY